MKDLEHQYLLMVKKMQDKLKNEKEQNDPKYKKAML